MRFIETKLPGAYVIEPERFEDDRGFFARTFCEREFAAAGLVTRWPQCNVSHNHARGTLRGMHYQAAPHEEVKLVRCTHGAVHDVIIDLRADSATFRQYVGVDLTARNGTMLYIPGGFAHGFLTLEDHTEVFYQMSAFYAPDYARGVRWDDPAFRIAWPSTPRIVCERDAAYPDIER